MEWKRDEVLEACGLEWVVGFLYFFGAIGSSWIPIGILLFFVCFGHVKREYVVVSIKRSGVKHSLPGRKKQ